MIPYSVLYEVKTKKPIGRQRRTESEKMFDKKDYVKYNELQEDFITKIDFNERGINKVKASTLKDELNELRDIGQRLITIKQVYSLIKNEKNPKRFTKRKRKRLAM